MTTTVDTGHSERWRISQEVPLAAWDERMVLGSRDFQENPDRPDRLRVLLVGHSHDLDLARIAGLLDEIGVRPDVLLVDRVGRQPTVHQPDDGAARRYDVGYCRAIRSDSFVHYHFDRTLRRSEDWDRIGFEHRTYAAAQADGVLWGWLAAVRVTRWINSPWRLRDAENKLVQLACAGRAGLRIPRTVVTADVDELRQFGLTCPAGVVHKSLGSPVVGMDQVTARFVYTSAIDQADVEDLDYPTLFQERLTPVIEHRVTVVGRRLFAAALPRTREAEVDWRRSTGNHSQFEHGRLPDAVAAAIRAVLSGLRIDVGAADLIETEQGIYFLEVNPSAAMLWLERALGMKLYQSVVQLICSGR